MRNDFQRRFCAATVSHRSLLKRDGECEREPNGAEPRNPDHSQWYDYRENIGPVCNEGFDRVVVAVDHVSRRKPVSRLIRTRRN